MPRPRALRYTAAKEILRRTEVQSALLPDPTKPTGPYNRVCDISLGMRLLGWEPKVSFSEGLDRTIRWYYETKNAAALCADFDRLLTER